DEERYILDLLAPPPKITAVWVNLGDIYFIAFNRLRAKKGLDLLQFSKTTSARLNGLEKCWCYMATVPGDLADMADAASERQIISAERDYDFGKTEASLRSGYNKLKRTSASRTTVKNLTAGINQDCPECASVASIMRKPDNVYFRCAALDHSARELPEDSLPKPHVPGATETLDTCSKTSDEAIEVSISSRTGVPPDSQASSASDSAEAINSLWEALQSLRAQITTIDSTGCVASLQDTRDAIMGYWPGAIEAIGDQFTMSGQTSCPRSNRPQDVHVSAQNKYHEAMFTIREGCAVAPPNMTNHEWAWYHAVVWAQARNIMESAFPRSTYPNHRGFAFLDLLQEWVHKFSTKTPTQRHTQLSRMFSCVKSPYESREEVVNDWFHLRMFNQYRADIGLGILQFSNSEHGQITGTAYSECYHTAELISKEYDDDIVPADYFPYSKWREVLSPYYGRIK
ncbi:hypothetical protein K474DRAFT_1680928, partial [Panus rudis PR-1116 ss-1]